MLDGSIVVPMRGERIMVKLDPNNAFHARAAERLKTEEVGWLVTVSDDGTPQPSPVWFLWDGADTLLIYSQDHPKTRYIAARPRVAFHFNDENGGNVVTLTGSAIVDSIQPKIIDHAGYRAKYDEAIKRIGYTTESFSDAYAVAIVVTLEKLRGH
jgi:PPOX class probable F420-dependent enzyme